MLSTIQINNLLLPTCKGIEMINTADIVRIKAISNYSKLIFANGKTGAIKMSNGELVDIARRKKIFFFQCWYNSSYA